MMSKRQLRLVNHFTEHLSEPRIIHLIIERPLNISRRGDRIGVNHALLYWLCKQRQFHNVCWFSLTGSESRHFFDEFESMMKKTEDKRVMESREEGVKLKLRDDENCRWSFQFKESGKLRNPRGMGTTDILWIINSPNTTINDMSWLNEFQTETKFIWLWSVTREEISQETTKRTLILKL